jgi:hypothetical protein
MEWNLGRDTPKKEIGSKAPVAAFTRMRVFSAEARPRSRIRKNAGFLVFARIPANAATAESCTLI